MGFGSLCFRDDAMELDGPSLICATIVLVDVVAAVIGLSIAWYLFRKR